MAENKEEIIGKIIGETINWAILLAIFGFSFKDLTDKSTSMVFVDVIIGSCIIAFVKFLNYLFENILLIILNCIIMIFSIFWVFLGTHWFFIFMESILGYIAWIIGFIVWGFIVEKIGEAFGKSGVKIFIYITGIVLISISISS